MLSPTTSPELFTALAKLVLPPSVPRSTARNAGVPALPAAATPVVKTKSAASAKTAARAWAKLLSIGKPLCSRRPRASFDCPSDDRSDPDPGHPPKEGARKPSTPHPAAGLHHPRPATRTKRCMRRQKQHHPREAL